MTQHPPPPRVTWALLAALFPLYYLSHPTLSRPLLPFSLDFPPFLSPGLENPSEGSFSDVPHILDVVPWVLQGQQLGVEQQRNPLVHGVWVESVQQQLRRQSAQRRVLHRSVEPQIKPGERGGEGWREAEHPFLSFTSFGSSIASSVCGRPGC